MTPGMSWSCFFSGGSLLALSTRVWCSGRMPLNNISSRLQQGNKESCPALCIGMLNMSFFRMAALSFVKERWFTGRLLHTTLQVVFLFGLKCTLPCNQLINHCWKDVCSQLRESREGGRGTYQACLPAKTSKCWWWNSSVFEKNVPCPAIH